MSKNDFYNMYASIMKTLHLTIISFLLCVIMSYAGIVSAQSPSNDLGNGSLLSFKVTTTSFLPGDVIEIQGASLPNSSVTLVLLDPNGITKDSKLTFSDRDGQFSSFLKIPKYAEGGTWKILGKSGTYNAESDFDIFEPQPGTCQGCHPNIPQSQNNNVTVLSPLKQFDSGIAANDIVCKGGLQLIFKAEDSSPACVKPDTVTKLIQRGWATNSPKPHIDRVDIVGLKQSYQIGQPIKVAAQYSGYWNSGGYINVIILNANNATIWHNSDFTHTETPGLHNVKSNWPVENENGYPIINETGTYTMIVYFEGKTAESQFAIVK
ncbi:MAG TPA: hypothetical protein VGR54_02900 [Nitrosopumilaceae archaeon]|nr:hypothetical protein [Nitrosopumilaceae archaeon]